MVDRKLVEAPQKFQCWPPQAALLFSSVLSPLSYSFSLFFLVCFIVVVSIVSICLEQDSSIVVTCPSMPAACFPFSLFLFVLFSLFVVVLSGSLKQHQGRGLVNRKLV